MIAPLALEMAEADSVTLLRRALFGAVELHATRVILADADAVRFAAMNQPAEAARNARRSIELARRRDLLQLLLDQVPTTATALSEVPMGTR